MSHPSPHPSCIHVNMVPVMDILIVHHRGLDPPGAVLTLEHVGEVGKELPEGNTETALKPRLSEMPTTPGMGHSGCPSFQASLCNIIHCRVIPSGPQSIYGTTVAVTSHSQVTSLALAVSLGEAVNKLMWVLCHY